MNRIVNRRKFLGTLGVAGLAGKGLMAYSLAGESAPAGNRKMTICLVCGAIGVSANQVQAIDLASRHGFEAVEAYGGYLASLSETQLQDLLAQMKAKGIVFGAAGLPVDFRQDDARFAEGMKGLPLLAAGLKRAGVDRMGTYLMSGHSTLTYLQNFKQHAARLRQAAEVLKDHGVRLGFEYVGTKTLRDTRRYPFIHTMAETRELIAEIGLNNVGFVLDSWHWHCARETPADILTLKNEQIISVDLNDAPDGIPVEQLIDNRRELPTATGVIDVGAFLNALRQVGYDGPVRAEPFNKALNDLPNEEACAATAQAMKRAFAVLQ
ncbi:MAG: sugar phosphate isomerase/epimerase family protein [Verrucomicrobiota bacterium]